MQTVSPEDRMQLITRQHDEWRRQAAVDHGIASASASREPSGARDSGSHRFLAVRHFLGALAHGHGTAPHGVAH